MYLEDLGSDCHGGMEIIIRKQYAVKDVVTNTASPFVDFGWQPTPVFLPGESQGRGSLVGCHLWGRRVDTTSHD